MAKGFPLHIRRSFSLFFANIPAGIWSLGLFSGLTNVSSSLSMTLTPLFLTSVLGASMTTLGMLEGVVEAAALLIRVLSGAWSDWIHKRKPVILWGSALAILAKVFLVMVSTVQGVFVSRLLDRFSNGIQASPRDALVGDIAPQGHKGACYGLRQTLAVMGSFVGAFCSMGLMWATSQNYRLIFAISLIPVILGAFFLVWGVQETTATKVVQRSEKYQLSMIKLLPWAYWKLVSLSVLFMLGNLSVSFLILGAKHHGASETFLPLLIVLQSLATCCVAFPLGKLADAYLDRRVVLGFGFAMLTLSHLVLGLAGGLGMVLVGVALCGFQMGITQNALSVFITEICPAALRGTGFGIFHFSNGISLLLSNMLMGFLWDAFSPGMAFCTTTIATGLGLLALPWLAPRPKADA